MGKVFELQARRQRPSQDQAVDLAGELVHLAQLARVQLVALDMRRTAVARSGYRSASHFEGGGRGRSLTGDGHGDPIGELVAQEVDADAENKGPVRQAHGEAVDAIHAAVVLLRSATGSAQAVLDPSRPAGPEDQGCTSHADHGFRGVPTRSPGGDLCRWCADFWRKYQQRPSKNDLQMLEERRVHTEQMRQAA